MGLGAFEERLLDRLVTLQANGQQWNTGHVRTTAPSPSLRRLVLTATAMVAATFFVVATFQASLGPPISDTAAPPVALETRTLAAMSTASAQVVFHSSLKQDSGNASELWRDDQTGAWRMARRDAAGEISWETAFRIGDHGAVHGVTINYVDHTWGERVVEAEPGQGRPLGTADALQAQLAENFKSGRSTEIGTEVVDGRMTTLVRTVGAKGESSTLWIDNETLLPVRQVGESIDVTYSWTPRTPENLAALWPTPPVGFTKLDGPPLPPGVKLPSRFGRS